MFLSTFSLKLTFLVLLSSSTINAVPFSGRSVKRTYEHETPQQCPRSNKRTYEHEHPPEPCLSSSSQSTQLTTISTNLSTSQTTSLPGTTSSSLSTQYTTSQSTLTTITSTTLSATSSLQQTISQPSSLITTSTTLSTALSTQQTTVSTIISTTLSTTQAPPPLESPPPPPPIESPPTPVESPHPPPPPIETPPPPPPVESPPPATCPEPLDLGLASKFAALGASTLTSTGPSVLTGDAGVFPGSSITGFPPGVVSGTIYFAQAEAQEGKAACQSAYTSGVAKVGSATSLIAELGDRSLTPGVYTFPSLSAGLTGTLTLVGSGDTCGGGQFIFIIPTTLTTAAASAVVLANGARACNVYFLMGTSATIGAGSMVKGNFLASASISAGEAASNDGTFCALGAAVTLIDNDLESQGACSAA